MKKLKIGVAGRGSMGAQAVAGLQALENVEIVAVVITKTSWDGTFEKVGNLNLPEPPPRLEPGSFTIFQSVPGMLAGCPDLDAVVVALPTHLQVAACEAVADAGKHLFCQKPVGTDLEAVRQLATQFGSSGKVIQPGFVLRYWWSALWDVVASNKYGELVSLKSWRHVQIPSWTGWFKDIEKSGGALGDLGPHELDLVRWFGLPTQGRGEITNDGWAYNGRFIYQNGATAEVEGSWNESEGFDTGWRAVFENGTFEWTCGEDLTFRPYGGGEVESFGKSPGEDDMYGSEMAAFVANCRGGAVPKQTPKIGDSVEAHRLIQTIRNSACERRGRFVEVVE